MPRRAYSLLNTTLSMSLAYLLGSNNLKLLMPSVNLTFLILRFCRTVMNKKIHRKNRFNLWTFSLCTMLYAIKHEMDNAIAYE